VVYTTIDMMYCFVILIGSLVLQQPIWQWPLLSNHPWTACCFIYPVCLSSVLSSVPPVR
jgi:hypothetical protein